MVVRESTVGAIVAALGLGAALFLALDGPDSVPERLDSLLRPGCEASNGHFVVEPVDDTDSYLSTVADLDGWQFSRAVDRAATRIVRLSCEVGGATASYFSWSSHEAMVRAVRVDESGQNCVLEQESFQGVGPGRMPDFCDKLGGRLVQGTGNVVEQGTRDVPGCSQEIATQKLRKSGLVPDRGAVFKGAGRVICHDFTDDGIRDMAFTRAITGTAGTIGWGVFKAVGPGWRLELFRPNRSQVGIKADGEDLLVGASRYASRDARGAPTRGYRIERYRFNLATDRFRRTDLEIHPHLLASPPGFATDI